MAKNITVALALHLADLVASFLTEVLDGQAVLLFGTGTSALLQAFYWVRPICEELLHALVPRSRCCASNGLAKIVSGKVGSAADQPPQTASSYISSLTVLGQSLNASVFFFSTAERAIKHCRSSGYIRSYDQKDACRTCKKHRTKHKQKPKETKQPNTTKKRHVQ